MFDWLGLGGPSYDDEEDIVVYRCTECGKVSVSLGWLHGHAETHRRVFGLIVPPWRLGDFDALMELTEVIRVDESSVVALEEVRGA